MMDHPYIWIEFYIITYIECKNSKTQFNFKTNIYYKHKTPLLFKPAPIPAVNII